VQPQPADDDVPMTGKHDLDVECGALRLATQHLELSCLLRSRCAPLGVVRRGHVDGTAFVSPARMNGTSRMPIASDAMPDATSSVSIPRPTAIAAPTG